MDGGREPATARADSVTDTWLVGEPGIFYNAKVDIMINKITLTVEGISIVGQFFLPKRKGLYPAVCICHGIPAGISEEKKDGGYPELAGRMCREGFAVFIFNFRGTGESGGNFDLAGWARDLEAVIDYLWELSELERAHLSLLGFSGGAAIAIYVAANDKRVSCVAACACPAEFTFLSGVDEPQKIVDYFRGIGIIRDEGFPASAEKWLNDFNEVRPSDYIAGIAPRPLLLVHGNKDETVDVDHARGLYERAGKPKQLTIIDGAGHRLRQDERAMKQVIGWLKNRCQVSICSS
jgi:alpha/beta superfamily hydrolase